MKVATSNLDLITNESFAAIQRLRVDSAIRLRSLCYELELAISAMTCADTNRALMGFMDTPQAIIRPDTPLSASFTSARVGASYDLCSSDWDILYNMGISPMPGPRGLRINLLCYPATSDDVDASPSLHRELFLGLLTTSQPLATAMHYRLL